MPSCAVITCRARSQVSNVAQSGISFHRFPKDQFTKEQWISITGRDKWKPTRTSTICSKHFRDDQFITKHSGYRYLMMGAVPCQNIVTIHSNPTKDFDVRHFNSKEVKTERVEESADPEDNSLDNEPLGVGRLQTERVSAPDFGARNSYSTRVKTERVEESADPEDGASDDEPLGFGRLQTEKVTAQDFDGRNFYSTEVKTERVEESADLEDSSSDDEPLGVGRLQTELVDPLSTRHCISPTDKTNSSINTKCKKPINQNGKHTIYLNCKTKHSEHENKDGGLRKVSKDKEDVCKRHVEKIQALVEANRRLCQQNKNLKTILMTMKRKIKSLQKK